MKNDIFVSYIKTINNLIRINTVHKKFSGGDVLPICARSENATPPPTLTAIMMMILLIFSNL